MEETVASYSTKEVYLINCYRKSEFIECEISGSAYYVYNIVVGHFPNCTEWAYPTEVCNKIVIPEKVFEADSNYIDNCSLLRTPIEETFYGRVFLKYFEPWDICHFIKLVTNSWTNYSVVNLYNNTNNEESKTNQNRTVLLKKYIVLEIGKLLHLTSCVMISSTNDSIENYSHVSQLLFGCTYDPVADQAKGWEEDIVRRQDRSEKIFNSLSYTEIKYIKSLPDFVMSDEEYGYSNADKFYMTEYLEQQNMYKPILRFRRDPIPIIQIEI
jgi:hypothetical protein